MSSEYTDKGVGTELRAGDSFDLTNNFKYKARLIAIKNEWKKILIIKSMTAHIKVLNLYREITGKLMYLM